MQPQCTLRVLILHRKRINISTVLAGQRLGIKEVDDGIGSPASCSTISATSMMRHAAWNHFKTPSGQSVSYVSGIIRNPCVRNGPKTSGGGSATGIQRPLGVYWRFFGLENQLLGTLEGLGYVIRSAMPDATGARVVRFTKRGHAAYKKMAHILQDIEHEWNTELGPRRFAQLKALLGAVWDGPLVR